MNLDRIAIVDNIIDRIERIEARLQDLASGAVTIQEVLVQDTPGTGMLNGWLATGTAFQDVAGRIVLDASLPGITLAPGGIIKSQDYEAGLSGFKIDGGFAEFNDVTVRGTIYASAGEIAGWIVDGRTLRDIDRNIILDGANASITLDAIGKITSEDYIAGTSGFVVSGSLVEFNQIIARGTIYANAGVIGGWDINASTISTMGITLDPVTPAIALGSVSGYLSGIGIWMGNDGGTYKLHIGDPANDHLRWSGNELFITGKFIGSSDIGTTEADSLVINSDRDDVTAKLILGRTTGGDAELAWNGALLSLSGGGVPVSIDGQLQLPVVGSAGGLLIGEDTLLYRDAADVLRTPDSVRVDGELFVGVGDSARGTLALYGASAGTPLGGQILLYTAADHDDEVDYWQAATHENDLRLVAGALGERARFTAEGQLQLPAEGSAAGISLGGDAQLYRDAADELHTPDALTVDGALSVGAGAVITGALDVGQDLTVGQNVLFVDQSGARVGVNCAPDPQFALDVGGPARAQYWIGPHALQLPEARMICHFDGPLPLNRSYEVDVTGHMGQTPTGHNGVLVGVEGKFQKGLFIAPAGKNECRNPIFETDVSYWNASSLGSILRVTSISRFGLASLQMFSGGGQPYCQACYSGGVTAFSPSAYYAASGWYYNESIPLGGEVWVRFYFQGGSQASAFTDVVAGIVEEGGWHFIHAVAYPDYSDRTSVDIYFHFRGCTADGQKAYLDGVTIEQGRPFHTGTIAPYMPGYTTGGDGRVSRPSTKIQYPYAVPRTEFTVLAWVKASVAETDFQLFSTYGRWLPRFLQIGSYYTNPSLIIGSWCRSSATDFYYKDQNDADWTDVKHLHLNYQAEEWILVAATWDGTTLTAYGWAESQPLGLRSSSLTVGDGFGLGDDLPLYLFSDCGVTVDELTILSKALTETEILAIIESNAPVFAESSVQAWRSPTQVPIWVDEEGLWAIDENGNKSLGWSAVAGKSWGGQSLDAGDFLLGQGSEYILWDASEASLTIAGDGSGVTNIDGGNIQAGTVTATQIAAGTITATEIAAGAVTATEIDVSDLEAISASMGTLTSGRIELFSSGSIAGADATGLVLDDDLSYDSDNWHLLSLGSGAWQVGIGTDGKFYAGEGSVTLDDDGLSISAGAIGYNQVKWVNGGSTIAYIYGTYSSGDTYLRLGASNPDTSGDKSEVTITTPDDTGSSGTTTFTLTGGSSQYLQWRIGGFDYRIRVTDSETMMWGDARVEDGLYVGGVNTAPDANDIHYEGNLRPVRSSTYTGYVLVPYRSGYTSTNYDGDSVSSGSTLIDVSSEFGISDTSDIQGYYVRLVVKDNSAEQYVALGSGTTGDEPYHVVVRTQVSNQYVEAQGIVWADSNGDFYIKTPSTIDFVAIQIFGLVV